MATTARTAGLEEALRSVLPDAVIATDPAAYAVDGRAPSLAVSPSTVEEVAAVLRSANDMGVAVIPWGTGSRMALGRPPPRYDLALDLSRLNHMLEYEPADLTVTVEAGLKLSELQRRLREHGQWLPLDPPDGTIGGLLAENASGSARMAHGSARDLVIGLQVVTASGELIKSGGRVVKNVAGYDLAKLHIGGLGTLGIIVQASFKVAPLPKLSTSMTAEGPLKELMSISLQVRNRGLAINGLTLGSVRDVWQLTVRFAGGVAAVERSGRDVEAIMSENGLRTTDMMLQAEPAAGAVVRVSTVPMKVVEICEALAGTGAAVAAYPTVGLIRGSWEEPPPVSHLESLRRLAESGGGALVVEAGPVELKQDFDVWGAPNAPLELMGRLKEQFDPNGTLNPGRYIGGL